MFHSFFYGLKKHFTSTHRREGYNEDKLWGDHYE